MSITSDIVGTQLHLFFIYFPRPLYPTNLILNDHILLEIYKKKNLFHDNKKIVSHKTSK